MRNLIAVAVLMTIAGGARADVIPAGGPEPYAGPVVVEPMGGGASRSLIGHGAFVDPRTGVPVSTTTRLNPVVGSVQRGHTNPLTGRTKYTSTVYNPVLGSFGAYKFRR